MFLEQLGAFGGSILDADGHVAVDSEPAVRALTSMRDMIDRSGITPNAVLTWQEEQVRFAFENGETAMMRNWPYAYPLLQDSSESRVAGKFAVAPLPGGPGGAPTAALGGSELAINAFSEQPDAAYQLIDYLLQPAQMIERARVAGQLPPRPALYASARSGRRARHSTRRCATGDRTRGPAAGDAGVSRVVRDPSGLAAPRPHPSAGSPARSRGRRGFDAPAAGEDETQRVAMIDSPRQRQPRWRRDEQRLAWALSLPALAIVASIAAFPIAWTFWESLHVHDLRMPWLGRPFVGVANYVEAFNDVRLRGAVAHTCCSRPPRSPWSWQAASRWRSC